MARNKAYREAKREIEKARRSGAKSFSLINWGLTELPESIGQLAQLQSLDLSGNELTAVPDTIVQLTQLRELNLTDNELTAVPDTIVQLTQLRELNLTGNKLTTVPDTIDQLTHLQTLNLNSNHLTAVPESIGKLTQLQKLNLTVNRLTSLPKNLSQLEHLEALYLWENPLLVFPVNITNLSNLIILSFSLTHLVIFPTEIFQLDHLTSLAIGKYELSISLLEEIVQMTKLRNLYIEDSKIKHIPESISQLIQLEGLTLKNCQLSNLPSSLAKLEYLEVLNLSDNPLNPELAAAYEDGLDAVKAYLRAKAGTQITLNEAKLILVGEGEVGKTCLMDALEGKPWQEHPTTHGIEIRTITAVDPDSDTEITLNGWDFGGQRVYRPTHQLFFSSPAVYLVVWKPREGPQQGFVKEWIKLIKHREPDAKILIVATHGGPQQRQPDIDRQELWDLFGKETIIDFFHVESKPDANGQRRGITELKQAIAHVAAALPEMGRSVPESFQEARHTLQATGAAYLPLTQVLDICREHEMDDDVADLFVTISHRLGHLIHYEHDPALRDIVVLKPDWLATAISFALDDAETRQNYGLVSFERLSQLWRDPKRKKEEQYDARIHRIFLRLMERFDLSYRVAGLSHDEERNPVNLIAQLVPDNRPEESLKKEWIQHKLLGDSERVQICQIVDEQSGQSANAEGLFFQLIVRLHRYSLGRTDYNNSLHWQRGLVLDHEYNGRALVEHRGNDIRITVRAPYPEGFLTMLTEEVKYLVKSFWDGLRCNVMVPCITPCGKETPGTSLFEVEKLIVSKRKNRPDYPCRVCDEWQNIDSLLRNAPAAQPLPSHVIDNRDILIEVRKMFGRFDKLDKGQAIILSQIDTNFNTFIQLFTDEAKEGPRLFTLVPVERSKFNPKQWTSAKFRLTLWCEHSRMPLTILNPINGRDPYIDVEMTREWFKKSAPYLKFVTSLLSLVLPIATSGIEFRVDETAFKVMEEQLNLGTDIIAASLEGGQKATDWLETGDVTTPQQLGKGIRAEGATLRELQALLKEKDPGFGGLIRVRNKRQEFLWVHPQFENEY